jgi:hypothetical protein
VDTDGRIRLLIATEFPPNGSGGGPAVLRQMLRGWPIEDLFWWNCIQDVDTRFRQDCAARYVAKIPAKLVPYRRLTRIKSALLGRFWAAWAEEHLAKAVVASSPNVIWAVPHNWSILPLGILRSVPMGFHVTVQDYVNVHGQEAKFGSALCSRMTRLADQIYASATTRDATSHPMLEDLARRTGVLGEQMLHAGVEESELQILRDRRAKQIGEIRIAYAGTILVAEEFELFVRALRGLRALSLPISLRFFGSHSYSSAPWFETDWMQEFGNLDESALIDSLRSCTWGFAPMALNDRDPRYNRFSFPTKFITYLAAGLPVISVGHPESSVMKMAKEYRVGPSTSAATVETLIEALQTPLANRTPWSTYAAEIIRCAETEFRASNMRSKLWSCFERCAEATRAQRAPSAHK